MELPKEITAICVQLTLVPLFHVHENGSLLVRASHFEPLRAFPPSPKCVFSQLEPEISRVFFFF